MREGVYFNYGLNAVYNFGQQYVENHAYQDKANDEVFDISDNLDTFDNSVASIVRSDLKNGLAKNVKLDLFKSILVRNTIIIKYTPTIEGKLL